VTGLLEGIQQELYDRALQDRERRTRSVDSYEALKAALPDGGFFLVPWADDADNEAAIKADCRATIRCYPIEGQEAAAGATCFYSGRPATHMALFARAY
jgi:prolyl-tRNA synthetase